MCYVCAKSLQLCLTLSTLWTDSAKLLCPWISPGKNTGVGYPALLQGIFPTQGSKPHLLPLLHRRRILYCWATREAQNKNIRYILVQLLYGRWYISWRWHLDVLWLGDVEMNFGITEAWIKFKLWLFLNVCPWENYLVSLHLCFSSVKPPLSTAVDLEIHLFIPYLFSH